MKLFGAIKNLFQWLRKPEVKDALEDVLKTLRDTGLLQVLIAPTVENIMVDTLTKKGIERNKAELFANAALGMFAEAVDSRDPKAVAIQKLKEKVADPDARTKLITLGVQKANLPVGGAGVAAEVVIAEVQKLLDRL